ncbi:HpaII family restriction endonuclease [Flavobacterium adhaerens]|uniref:HpaII family restriction endonuclease n=1 Tax=Flavobacterium adhaerens TaxID=3149043 RepID=UPI0034DB3918
MYTLLKVISGKELYTSDSNLNRIEALMFLIIKVLHNETNGVFEFSYDNNLVVVRNTNGES